MTEKKIKLNGQSLTESEFNAKKSEIESKPDVRLIKINENTYKTELRG